MRNVQRFYIPNAIVFITAVTRGRHPIFAEARWGDLLWETMRTTQQIHRFRLMAYAILPDHLHWLMLTPVGVTYSQVMHSIKRNLTLNYKSALGITAPVGLWQNRFWDHIIRDAGDLWRHFDYIHYNPIRHGLATRPEDWARSSYGFWLERGYYESGWGQIEPEHLRDMDLD